MIDALKANPDLNRGANVLVHDYMAVQRNETVLITADTASDMAAVGAVFNSVDAAGARPALMVIPQLPYQGALADPYVTRTLHAAALNCDVWLDLTWPYFAGSGTHGEAMKQGKVRYLLCGDIGSEGISRLYGMVDLDQYFSVLNEFDRVVGVAIGKTARVTNGLGSDVSFTLAKPGISKPRHCEKPGMYVTPGGGSIYPEMESVRGVIVVNAMFHEYYTVPDQPMTFRIDGKLREIEATIEDAVVLVRCLEQMRSNFREAFRLYEDARFDRTARIQIESHRNEWGKSGVDHQWVYSYDAMTVPLGVTHQSIVPAQPAFRHA